MDLGEMFQEFIDGHIKSDVYTALPATVTNTSKFNSKQYVDVVTTVKRKWDDDRGVAQSAIYNVPVVMPAGGGGLLSFPVKTGDSVLLIFGMRDIDGWRQSDGSTDDKAKTSRSHSLTDAIAIVGLFTENSTMNPSTDNVELRFEKSSVVQKPDGTVDITNGAGTLSYKPSGELLHPSGAKVTSDGDFVTASGKSLNNHVHQGSPTAATGPVSNTGAPI